MPTLRLTQISITYSYLLNKLFLVCSLYLERKIKLLKLERSVAGRLRAFFLLALGKNCELSARYGKLNTRQGFYRSWKKYFTENLDWDRLKVTCQVGCSLSVSLSDVRCTDKSSIVHKRAADRMLWQKLSSARKSTEQNNTACRNPKDSVKRDVGYRNRTSSSINDTEYKTGKSGLVTGQWRYRPLVCDVTALVAYASGRQGWLIFARFVVAVPEQIKSFHRLPALKRFIHNVLGIWRTF